MLSHPRTSFALRQLVAATALAAVAVAGCSSGGDSGATPPTTTEAANTTTEAAPTTTEAAPTTTEAAPTVPPGSRLEMGAGFMALELPETWSADEVTETLPARAVDRHDRPGFEWSLDEQLVSPMAELVRSDSILGSSVDDVLMLVGVEPRFVIAEEEVWRAALLDAVVQGDTSGVAAPTAFEWAGSTGSRSRGTLGDGRWFQLDTVKSGSQFVATVSLADREPNAQVLAEIDAMLASVEVDDSVLPLLQHAIDARAAITAELTGTVDWDASFLIPRTWVLSEDPGPIFWTPVDADGFLSMGGGVKDPAFDFEARIAVLTADPFFEVPAVRVDKELDGQAYTVLYEGDPATAVAALILVDQGAVVLDVSIYTPGDSVLLNEIVDSLIFIVGS